GYAAFAAMHGGAGEFVTIVVARERVLSKALLAGDDGALQRPPQGFVRATVGRLRWAQHAQTQAAIRPRGRSTRPTRRSAFVCKLSARLLSRRPASWRSALPISFIAAG